jgi:Pyruvate/2-oxoacid:ferredoxin oxidoreductase delta subunit
MTSEHSRLGSCPQCDAVIPATRLLIEYETAQGTAAYAECPGCDLVVHPR